MDEQGDFPAYLRAQMSRKDLNSAELGRLAGVNPASISKWLRGLEVPSVENSRKTADALGVNLLEILVATGVLTRDEVRGRGTVVDLENLTDTQVIDELKRRLAIAASQVTFGSEQVETDSDRFTAGRRKRTPKQTSPDSGVSGS
ncbi:helix-turn-helix transcriptional regulator [Amycolatopsis sp., V23-08]|uniref:Helix-turn-helix transcriptional regulator n=1 Tax=Amycolatopsis heterodermiae TaxID=3110235 RepID=A0ABU5RN64_9PSEU|nr:helix-turn-helix transcriptional regulator [Amycolatopsis sp., V23-08]MEA5367766.1 helix-turn-helix transcriptional regulator [Amycolatopsis sp., V23-08]